jgi:hypothetical protein
MNVAKRFCKNQSDINVVECVSKFKFDEDSQCSSMLASNKITKDFQNFEYSEKNWAAESFFGLRYFENKNQAEQDEREANERKGKIIAIAFLIDFIVSFLLTILELKLSQSKRDWFEPFFYLCSGVWWQEFCFSLLL